MSKYIIINTESVYTDNERFIKCYTGCTDTGKSIWVVGSTSYAKKFDNKEEAIRRLKSEPNSATALIKVVLYEEAVFIDYLCKSLNSL